MLHTREERARSGELSGQNPGRPSKANRALCVILLVVHAALALHALRQQSLTVDEGGHVLSGVLAWEAGRFDVYAVNPPLIKALVALPVVASRPEIADEIRRTTSSDWAPLHDRFSHENRASYLAMIMRARSVLVALSVLGGWLVYRWSSGLFGPTAGLVGLALWTLSPNVLAWAGVCTVDLGATVFGLAAMVALRSYLHRPTWLAAGLTGWALGLALVSKFTLLILCPVFLVLWLIAWRQARNGQPASLTRLRWGHLALILVASVLMINTVYGLQRVGRPLGSFAFRSQALQAVQQSWSDGTRLAQLPVPLPEDFVTGLDEQKFNAENGPPAYLRGEWRAHGWSYTYLYALAVKAPIGSWLLALLALGLAVRYGRYRASAVEEGLVWLPAVAVVALLSSQMRDQYTSLRYILPAFPFLCIGISRVGLTLAEGWASVWSSPRGRLRFVGIIGPAVVVGALGWNGSAVLRIHPHYLSYFNELAGGPENGWRHLLESNIDWGQDLLYLKQWVLEHPEAQPIGLAYYGDLDPHLVGLNYTVPPTANASEVVGPRPGWYAVSVNLVCGAPYQGFDSLGQRVFFPADAFGYFQSLTPVAKAGYSIFIYHVTPDDTERLRVLVNGTAGPAPMHAAKLDRSY